jgi:hypothetical protein
MTTTVQKRQKEHKRQEKRKAKEEVRRNKTIAKRAQQQSPEHQGPPIADADTDATTITDADGRDIENRS